ncbi:hypothetical protein FB45DRAFT_24543 [Roridomyces roridus]|uniref:Uncharacterized protein n=1 Tax=Roridomyces roridus TaxID=1738132 RepID=A0AAD7FZ33_9AGAR|nr:hypothetical protein FB45DRAFT_24543 [Roridomyces roridus]
MYSNNSEARQSLIDDITLSRVVVEHQPPGHRWAVPNDTTQLRWHLATLSCSSDPYTPSSLAHHISMRRTTARRDQQGSLSGQVILYCNNSDARQSLTDAITLSRLAPVLPNDASTRHSRRERFPALPTPPSSLAHTDQTNDRPTKPAPTRLDFQNSALGMLSGSCSPRSFCIATVRTRASLSLCYRAPRLDFLESFPQQPH